MASGFVWPFQTEASSEYQRVDQGWDLQASAGAPVYAIASGTIGVANADPGGFGNDYPYQTLDNPPPGAPSNTVYYGHIHIIPGLAGKHVAAGQIIGYTNTTAGQNGSGAPPGWLEIGFAAPGTGAPIQRGAGATGAGQEMKNFLMGAPTGGNAMANNTGASNAQTAYQFFVAQGLSPAQAAGIIGNLQAESGQGLDPEIVNPSSGATGIAQWLGSRWNPALKTGNAAIDFQAQLQYIWQELNGPEASALRALRGATTAADAATVFSNLYERGGGADNGTRASYATSIFTQAQSGTWTAANWAASSSAPVGTGTLDTFGAAGGQAPGGPPSINDITALDTYVRENFGSDAWLLDIPEVKAVLEAAVAAGDNAGQIQAKIMQTNWWKTTSQAMQAFDVLSANTPAELNFSTPGSQAARQLADVMAAAAKAGVTISGPIAQQFALDTMKYGWDANQLDAAIANTIYYTGSGATAKTNAGAVIGQLQSAAGQYLMNPDDPTLQSWAQNIAAGTQTIEQFNAYLKQNASLKWTGMAPQIAQGYTPNQIVNNLRTNAAQTMEVDPSSVNFVTDPVYSKILDFVPPNSPNGVHRIMTQSEMDQYLKGTQQWQTTQQARDQVGQLATTLLTTFGKVAG